MSRLALANTDHAFLCGLAVAHLARAGGVEPVSSLPSDYRNAGDLIGACR
jgi:hypothetical protein